MELVAAKYKKTELGLIPEDWNLVEFQEVMDGFSSGQTPYRGNPEFYRGDIPWITSGELNYNVITDTKEKINIEGVQDANLKTIPKGTFLFAITGLEAAGTRGSCAITGIDATTNQSCMALYPKKGLLTTPYLYHFYVRYGNELAFKYCQGTKQQSFTGGIAKKLPIIIPPTIEEQTAIATVLSDTDALIDSLEKLIDKKRNIKQGAMQKLLQPKEGWQSKKLSEIGEIITGGTPPTITQEYWNGSIPWITPTDISIEKDIFHSEREISEAGLNVLRKLPANTLLVTCIASIGKNAILRKRGACNQQINAIVPNQENDVDFLYYLIENNKQYILSKAGITATLLISKRDFSEIIFSFPNKKEEQTHIATILSDMDAEINAFEIKLEKYRNVKSGMSQTLLTGKIRI
ncbi:MAG: restriction endonuclease subunit S [Saprospiraceae bacterium]|nr:restriction endonuclease subunit S [Saprospiraceae bacterium]MBP8115936.1 restriction endonuclease subunit S [Chitinophagaceae bacterium]